MPCSTVGMAFTTTQTLDAVLLNNLLFRNTANAPISSMYTIYANGKGQTFWGPAVKPENLSSFSTSLFSELSTLDAHVLTLTSSYTTLSTQTFPNTVSTLNGQLISSSAQFTASYNQLNAQFFVLSNTTNTNFNTLSNTLTSNVNLTTSTTIGIVTSTISGISSITDFTSSLAGLAAECASGSSTLSTAIYLENEDTVSTLTNYISTARLESISSSYAYTDAQISSLSSLLVTSSLITDLSTAQNLFLLGYISTFASTISTGFGTLSSQVYDLKEYTMSTQTWITSTLYDVSTSVSSLLYISSQLPQIVNDMVIDYTQPLFIEQDTKFSQYTSTIFEEISTLSSLTTQNAINYIFISTFADAGFSTVTSLTTNIFIQLAIFNTQLSVFTTSSILLDIYESFYELSTYATQLVQSSIDSITPFLSTLYYSTTVQTISSGAGYYDAYVSSVYLSSLSTMLPITSTYVSSVIGDLYSTSQFALLYTIDSTIFGKSSEFQSTNISLTRAFILSTQTLYNSSIAGFLSTPAGGQLSTFSTLSAAAISTFQGQGVSTLRSQSTIFGGTYATNTSTLSTQTGIGAGLISTLTNSFVLYSSTFSGLQQGIQQSSIVQFSTQAGLFNSSMSQYQFVFNSTLTSTNTGVLTRTVSTAGLALSSIVNSTNTIYTQFAASLAGIASTVTLSTLFTNQTINLTGTNFVGTMDFANFTNFTVNVRSPLISGSSNYRVTYNSNQIQNLNYRRGFITVDVSTVTTGYTNNGGRLSLDTYRWGLPTTMYSEFFPSISSADYTSLYSYTILNNVIYTNLLNVYPRLRIDALTIATPTNTGVSGAYWRGTPVTVSWSNYSFFPFGAIGAPAFNADVLVEAFSNNALVTRFGPFSFTCNTVQLQLPYITGAVTNPVPLQLRAYVVGKPLEAKETTVNVVMPQLASIQIDSAPGKFLAMNEVSAFSDGGTNAIAGLTNIFSFDGSGTSNAYFKVLSQNFTGSGRIEVASNVDFALNSDYTVEWFQNLFGGTLPAYAPIFSTETPNNPGMVFYWDNQTPVLGTNGRFWTNEFNANGLNGECRSMYIASDNSVYAGGNFTTAGATAVSSIARWNGSVWSGLGAGLTYSTGGNGDCYAITLHTDGLVYASGDFDTAGGVSANYIARWNPTTLSWSAVGSGLNGSCYALETGPDGRLYACGLFDIAGTNGIASWNGTSWSALGSGLSDLPCNALASGADGFLYVGGFFTTAGGITVNNIARWNPTTSTWSAMGSGLNGSCFSIAYGNDGFVYVGGTFSAAGGNVANRIARWNRTTSTWSALGSGLNAICRTLRMGPDGYLYAGGDFTTAGGVIVNRFARWDGTSWSPVISGTNAAVRACAVSGSNMYIGGEFTTVSQPTIATNRIASYRFPQYRGPSQAGILNNWRHIALSRQSSALRFFINGTNVSTFTSSESIPNSANLEIGSLYSTYYLSSYITNFRWTKGTALYTTNFIIPSTALTSQTNTRLLLNAVGTTPLDTSGTSKTVTRFNVSSIVNSPFTTGYTKDNLVDGNLNTIFASANFQDTPATTNTILMQPNLGTSLTSISSLVIRNISTVSTFMRANYSTLNDSQELEGAILRIGVTVGATTYQSTMTLTSSLIQTFAL